MYDSDFSKKLKRKNGFEKSMILETKNGVGLIKKMVPYRGNDPRSLLWNSNRDVNTGRPRLKVYF